MWPRATARFITRTTMAAYRVAAKTSWNVVLGMSRPA
jgi:hypothetical protein